MAANWEDSSERPAGSPLSGDIGARVAAIVHAAEREAHAAERAIADRRRAAEEEVQRYLAAARLRVDAEAAARAARLEALGTAARRLAAELSDATSALTQELHRADEDVATTLPHTPWPAPSVEPAASMYTPPVEPAASVSTRAAEPAAAAAAPPVAEPDVPAPTAEPTWTRNPLTTEPTWTPDEPAAEPAHAFHEPADPQADAILAHDEFPMAHSVTATTGAEVPSAARLVAIEMAVGGSSRAEVELHLREQHGAADPQELLDDVFGPASHAGSTLAWGQP
jgi:hypothetical protein